MILCPPDVDPPDVAIQPEAKDGQEYEYERYVSIVDFHEGIIAGW